MTFQFVSKSALGPTSTFNCEECFQIFAQFPDYRTHHYVEHGSLEWMKNYYFDFGCSECAFVTADPEKYKNHRNNEHGYAEAQVIATKLWICPYLHNWREILPSGSSTKRVCNWVTGVFSEVYKHRCDLKDVFDFKYGALKMKRDPDGEKEQSANGEILSAQTISPPDSLSDGNHVFMVSC